MAHKYVAVYLGRGISHAVFVCCGVGRCYWDTHITFFVQGVSKKQLKGKKVSFKGFNQLEHALAFAGAPTQDVELIDRERANKIKAEIILQQ